MYFDLSLSFSHISSVLLVDEGTSEEKFYIAGGWYYSDVRWQMFRVF